MVSVTSLTSIASEVSYGANSISSEDSEKNRQYLTCVNENKLPVLVQLLM